MSGETKSALRSIGAGIRELFAVRWVRYVLYGFVGMVVLRLFLVFLLGTALNRLAEPHELTCRWDSLDLSLLSGRGEIRYMEIRPSPEGEEGAQDAEPALVEIEYALFDLEVLPLLWGDLRVRRAEIDGLDTRLERAADGRWNLERHVDVARVLALLTEKSEEEEEPDPETPEGIDLSLPIAIEALRLQHARLRVIDNAITPAFDTVFECNARLSNLHTSGRPARFTVTLVAGEVLDGATLDGEAQWSPAKLELQLDAHAGGLRPGALEPYLDLLDIRPACESLEAALKADVELEVLGELEDTLRAQLEVRDAVVTTDGVPVLGLEHFEARLESLSPRSTHVPAVRVRGLHGHAELASKNALQIAGFELVGAPAESSEPAAWAVMVARWIRFWAPESWPSWASLLVREDPEAYPWSIDELSIEGGRFELIDQTVSPRAELELQLETIRIADIHHDPARAGAPIPLTAQLSVPGLAESVRLSGDLRPFAPERALALTLEATGLGLGGVDPYLKEAGFEGVLDAGSMTLEIAAEGRTDAAGRTQGWLELREAALRGTEDLFGVQRVAARDVTIDPAASTMRFGAIEIEQPKITLGRDPSSNLVIFGLRSLGRVASHSPAAAGKSSPKPSVTSPAAPAVQAPDDEQRARLEIGVFSWNDSDVRFLDEATDPPTTFELDELSFELSDLVLGGHPDDPLPGPAVLRASVRSKELFDEVSAEGTILSQPGPLDLTANVEIRGSGLRTHPIGPYLAPFGVEVTIENGAFELGVQAQAREADGGYAAELELTNGVLRDGETDLLGLGRLAAVGIELRGESIEVGELAVEGPFLRIEGTGSDDLQVARVGFRESAPDTDVDESAPEPSPSDDVAPAPAGSPIPELPPVKLAQVRVDGARVVLDGASSAGPLELTVDVQGSDWNTSAAPGSWDVAARIPGILEALDAEGTFTLGERAVALNGQVEANGVHAGPLAEYFPAGMSFASSGGRFGASFEARVGPSEADGFAALARARDVSWGEPGADPWFAADEFQLEAVRIDPASGVFGLGATHAKGLVARVERDADGALHAMGISVATPPPALDSPAEDTGPETPTDVAAEPVDGAPTQAVSSSTLQLPQIYFTEDLALELERLVFRDAGLGPNARPIEVGASLRVDGSQIFVNEDPSELPPLTWRTAARVPGLLEELAVEGTTSLFAEEPRITAELAGRGVRTAGLAEMVPALAGLLEGDVEDGRLEGRLDATLQVRRARANDLGLARPFSADVRMENIAYRESEGGRILAGLDEVLADVKQVDAKRGLVHVKTLELLTPRGEVWRDADGLHVLGIRVPLPEAAPDGAEESDEFIEEELVAEAADPEPTPAPEPRQEPDPDAGPAPELRIDQLLVTGVEFEMRDETVEPRLAVPITELDVELKRFSSLATSQPKPFQFNAFVQAGPPNPDTETPVFEELSMAGRLALYPDPKGHTQLQLDGLELVPFGGLAASQGLGIEDGALDTSLRLRFKGESGVNVSTNLVFSDLDLEETEEGFLERAIAMPMALDAALFLLRSPSGEHRFAVGTTVDRDGLSTASIALAATQAFAGVVAGALASAPFRLLGAVIPGGGGDDDPPPVSVFEFAAGSADLTPADRTELTQLGLRMEKDPALSLVLRHEFGTEDFARAEQLANPSRETCLEIVTGLRRRKSELLARHERAALEVRALYAVDTRSAEPRSEELRELERELARVEASLDEVLEVLRSDSPRQQTKRKRNTSRETAELRLDAASALLLQHLPLSPSADRVEVRSPRIEVAAPSAGGRVLVEIRRE